VDTGGGGEAWEERKAQVIAWLYHPWTVEHIRPWFKSVKVAKRYLRTLEKQKHILRVGRVLLGHGRPHDLYCTRMVHKRQLMHEYLGSRFLEAFLKNGAEAKRGADVDKRFRADFEMLWNGKMFFGEIDRITEPLWQVERRLSVYSVQSDAVLFITLNSQRIAAIRRECARVCKDILFTTVDRARDGIDTWFEDVLGINTQI